MTLVDCEESLGGLEIAAMDNEPLQKRLKRIGMSQKDFARLLGVSENTVSSQLRGKWESGTPQYVKAMILVLERLSIADRAAIMDEIDGGGI